MHYGNHHYFSEPIRGPNPTPRMHEDCVSTTNFIKQSNIFKDDPSFILINKRNSKTIEQKGRQDKVFKQIAHQYRIPSNYKIIKQDEYSIRNKYLGSRFNMPRGVPVHRQDAQRQIIIGDQNLHVSTIKKKLNELHKNLDEPPYKKLYHYQIEENTCCLIQ